MFGPRIVISSHYTGLLGALNLKPSTHQLGGLRMGHLKLRCFRVQGRAFSGLEGVVRFRGV